MGIKKAIEKVKAQGNKLVDNFRRKAQIKQEDINNKSSAIKDDYFKAEEKAVRVDTMDAEAYDQGYAAERLVDVPVVEEDSKNKNKIPSMTWEEFYAMLELYQMQGLTDREASTKIIGAMTPEERKAFIDSAPITDSDKYDCSKES